MISTVWITVTWADVMAGDTVRVPGHPESVSVVESVSAPGRWHTKVIRTWVDEHGKQRDVLVPHEHDVYSIRFVGRASIVCRPLADRIELLADAALTERRVRVILTGFPLAQATGEGKL